MTPSLSQAARDVLASFDQMNDLKTTFQSLPQRLVILGPHIQAFNERLEILRACLDHEQEQA